MKAIGKVLKKLCENKIKYSEKIQIILAHSTEKKALCIIFNMSNIDESYYDSLKKYLPDTLFSDDKNLEGKIKPSQLENLIEFTNEKLVIKPKKISDSNSYTNSVDNITKSDNILKIIDFFKKLREKLGEEKDGEKNSDEYKYVSESLNLLQSLKNNIEAGIQKSRTKSRFLLSLLFRNAIFREVGENVKKVGLKWYDTGNKKPPIGTEYKNTELSEALKGHDRKEFTWKELDVLGVNITDKEQYIVVGENYYTQVSDTNDYKYIEELLKQNISYVELT